MPIQIANPTPPPPVFLAPLAGITDLPYRRQVAAFGAGLVVTEMVASQEVVQARPEARSKAGICGDLETSSVQIAGRDPYWMAEAAKYVAGQGARIVDINMGCPAKKVVNGYSGSALMREPERALRIIEAIASAVDVPVTVKMRLGWDDDSHTAPQLAKSAADAGLAMVAFYGLELGLKCARKHLGWYMDDAGTPQALRREVLTADCPRAVERLLRLALAEHSACIAA